MLILECFFTTLTCALRTTCHTTAPHATAQVDVAEYVSLDLVRIRTPSPAADSESGTGRQRGVVVEWEARHVDLLEHEYGGYVRVGCGMVDAEELVVGMAVAAVGKSG